MSDDSRKIRFGLWYDFRNPSQWRQSPDRLYRDILDQIAWGENNGFDDVWLSEHHFIEGYLPSILPVAAAIGARTDRIRIASGVLFYDRYVAELRKANRPTDNIRFASGFWCLIVSEDLEKTFAEAADHIIYQANNYSQWLSAAGLQPLSEHLRDREQLRQSGLLKVVDPATAVSMIRSFSDTVPLTHFYSWTLPPGLPPRWVQTHLELFAAKVIPAFR